MREHVGLAEQVRQQLGVAAGLYAPAPLRAPKGSGTAAVGAFSFVLFAADPRAFKAARQAGVSAKRGILGHDARCGHEMARCACYRDFNDLNVRAQIVSG
jgi:hypothetical protein